MTEFDGDEGAAVEAAPAPAALEALLGTLRYLLSHPNRSRDLDRLAATLTESNGALAAVLFMYDERRGELAVRAAAGLEPIAGRSAFLCQARAVVEWAARTRTRVVVDDTLTDSRFSTDGAPAGRLIAHPLPFFDGMPAGLAVLFPPTTLLTGEALALNETLADVAALLLQNARLFAAWKETRRRLEELEALRSRNEHLVALGENAAAMARETRTPLATIGAMARRLGRVLPTGEVAREYAEIIATESERLDRTLKEQLDRSEAVRVEQRMEDLSRLAGDALLELQPALSRSRVRLIRRLATTLPALRLDVDRMYQVILGLIRSALEQTPGGGRLRVETKRMGDVVQLIVAADGSRSPGATLEQLLAPFAGAGGMLGPGAAGQIVKEHGGEIGVRSAEDWPTLYTVNLPIRHNEERRKSHHERRVTPRDRRRKGRTDLAA